MYNLIQLNTPRVNLCPDDHNSLFTIKLSNHQLILLEQSIITVAGKNIR